MAEAQGTIELICARCGSPFMATNARKKFCPDCLKAKAKERRTSRTKTAKTPGPVFSVENPQFSEEEKRILYPTEVWEEVPVPIEVFLSDPNYLGHSWVNSKGQYTLFPFWRKEAKKIYPMPMRSPFNVIILAGSTGCGKSSFAMGVIFAYYIYLTLCLRNPHEYFDLADQKEIVFAIINIVTKTMAYKNAWGMLQKMLLRSPWFMERGASTGGRRPEWYCTTKPVSLLYGRNEDDLIGLDLLGVFIDEISFARNKSVERQIEIAEEVYDVAWERLTSRFTKFGGIFEGLMCVASSKRTDFSFLESFTKKILDSVDSRRTYIIDKPRWEVLPPEALKPEKFPVAVGDKFRPPEVIRKDQVEEYEKAGYKIIWPPMNYYGEFQRNIQKALTNIAGISITQLSSWIRGDLVLACTNKERQNLFTQGVIFSSYKDNEEYYDYIDLSRITDEDLSKPLFIHIDASLGHDGNSIVGVIVDYAINQMNEAIGQIQPELHYKELFKLKVRAKPNTQTGLEKNRHLVFWLIDKGFNLCGLSQDQYGSAETLQIYQRQGIPAVKQSIDAVTQGINLPYQALYDAIFEKRIDLLDDEDQINELVSLEKYESGKVDKPRGGNDDTSQCLAGAVYLASKAKPELLYNGAVLLRQLDSSDARTDLEKSLGVNMSAEIERHFSAYSPGAVVAATSSDRDAKLKEDLAKFFGKKDDKKNNNGGGDDGGDNITSYWG